VRLVFADTVYWGALVRPQDQYKSKAIHAFKALGQVRLVTTDEVLTELLDGLSDSGPFLREAASKAVRRILGDEHATVYPQSRESFLAGLRLYEQRSDKGYSLVDCVSMSTMRREQSSRC
jgi:predicted nucleic acid-binding protein